MQMIGLKRPYVNVFLDELDSVLDEKSRFHRENRPLILL